MSHSWSLYVIVITVVNLIGLAWLLLATARKRRDGRSDNDTTGHVWDGDLTELNKPLPRWWLGMFILTMLFAVGYLVLYPGFGNMRGTLGWSSDNELAAQVADSTARQEARLATFRGQSLEQLTRDGEALKTGHNVFVNNCAVCHGSDARGAKGFPDLTDHDWLYGGDAETVLTSVRNGRTGAMPALAATLPDGGVAQVANYVRSLSGLPHDNLQASAGQPKFEMICAACHGKDGKGNPALGAPNLSDEVWLYGGTQKAIEETITYGRNGKMPSWASLLGPDRTRLVAAWVLAQSATTAAATKPKDAAVPGEGGGAP
jgi:cytochrome c oxidase cbb3-type subunit 3